MSSVIYLGMRACNPVEIRRLTWSRIHHGTYSYEGAESCSAFHYEGRESAAYYGYSLSSLSLYPKGTNPPPIFQVARGGQIGSTLHSRGMESQ